jgi:peroxiredoxin
VQKAPDFTLKDYAGKEHSLASYKGKIVVLEWTNPGCPFVRKHLKAETTTKLAEKYAKDGVVWLKVDSSHFVTPEDCKKACEENKVGVPVLLDADGKAGQAYGAKTTPHIFIVDKEGNLAYQGAYDDDPSAGAEKGAETKNYADAALAKLVKGDKPEVSKTQSYGCSVKYKK